MAGPTTANATVALSGRSAKEKSGRSPFYLSSQIILTGVLVGLALVGAYSLWPALADKPSKAVGAVLVSTLLPIGTLMILSLIERLVRPAGPRKSLTKWLLHLQLNIFYGFMAGFAAVLAVIVTTAFANRFGIRLGWFDLRFAEGEGVLLLIAAIWLSAIVRDFFFYWFHRACHQIPFLWAHHKMHHMDRELEAVTVARVNFLEVFIAALFIAVPGIILFKFDGHNAWELGLLSGTVATVFSTFIVIGHMNVRLQVGKLASLFYCGPQVHRIHHSYLPQHQDKNFAMVLPLWDVLFGTYYAPQRDEFPPTGVEGEKEIESFWEAEIFTLREWWRMFKAWRSQRMLRS